MIHKYRAWDEETEEMLYSDKDYERCTFVCEEDGILMCYVPEEIAATQDEPAYTVGREIFPIMQSTGFKDKNIDVYADDKIIITDGNFEAIGVVKMNDEEGQWIWVATEVEPSSLTIYEGREIPLWAVFDKQRRWKGCLVGNIHQHPNLLENKSRS